MIGNINAITYNEVFPHIKANRVWIGASDNLFVSVTVSFVVFSVLSLIRSKPAPGTRIRRERAEYMSQRSSGWFTNIDHGRRHEPLQLMTMADNIKFSKHQEVRGVGYPPYDNFPAIEVPFNGRNP